MNSSTIPTSLLLFALSSCLFGCAEYPPLEVVPRVDIARYIGTWYEIASVPVSQQEGCNCTTADYSIIDDATLRVVNRCRKGSPTGEVDEASGKAFVVEGSNNAKLRVQFFWPFRGDYWILDLAHDYSYAVVGTPSRKYFWILSRQRAMDNDLLNKLLSRLQKQGFDISKVQRTDQSCSE